MTSTGNAGFIAQVAAANRVLRIYGWNRNLVRFVLMERPCDLARLKDVISDLDCVYGQCRPSRCERDSAPCARSFVLNTLMQDGKFLAKAAGE
ncbi:hypothetical protein [uncultured Methanoregula sp.]|uniref:hypothetical protein n=1 Tax=uncultured Methanoregula sp. TaxID=1005933 RepID=UPI002AAA7419|nr:hypothetical protein [uncultured Methanoregula sp.]